MAKDAAVMKLVDIGVSKSPAGNGVRVRVPPAAHVYKRVGAASWAALS